MIFLEICPFSLSFKIYCRKVFHCILIFKSGFNVFLPALPVLISTVTSLSSLSLPFKKTWWNVWVFYSLFQRTIGSLLVFYLFSVFYFSDLLFSYLPVSNCIFLGFVSPSLQLPKLFSVFLPFTLSCCILFVFVWWSIFIFI